MTEVASPAQIVADLEWAIRSPALLSDSVLKIPDCDLGAYENRLADFVGSLPSHKVGKYFERLVEFYLREIRRVEILAAGQQIQRDGQTIGELDFVFRDADGSLHHWETAVKFYLYTGETTVRQSRLVGPNPSDNFESKLRRLMDHQLPLGRSEYPSVDAQHAFVRGCIFYPPSADAGQRILPRQLNNDHLTGTWIRASQWNRFQRGGEMDAGEARVYNKPHWLAPPVESRSMAIENLEILIPDQFRTASRPLMLSLGATESGSWREQARVIVVSDGWPSSDVQPTPA